MNKISKQTITDFGKQWKRYPDNDGYYGSTELFKDFCGSLLSEKDIKNKIILEIGSGTGRIVNMLIELGAKHVYAIEPSESYDVLISNIAHARGKVTCYQVRGENIPSMEVDLAISFGVLHHIPEPKPVVDKVYERLKKGGKFIVWVYGYEGNESYLSIFLPLRKVTSKLPDFLLDIIAIGLNYFLWVYIVLCKAFELPLKKYVLSVFSKLDWKSRKMVIFDQLNPMYAKYYTQAEAKKLLVQSGFKKINFEHRHEYSWSIIGEK
jgi:SAM-dependent methyltransferase